MTSSYNKIVVGVDGSDHSTAALRWAVGHAERTGSSLEAVFAWQLPMIGIPGAFDRGEMEAAAKDFLVETVSAAVPSPPIPLELTVAEGDPTTSLVAAARGADMLVVGTRGRTPFKGLLLGSVSQGCASTAACPVVVVKLNGATPAR